MLLLFSLLLVVVAALSITATVGTNLAALTALLAAPGQLRLLARDRRARRNLALGHATVNVLRERLGRDRLVVLAHPDGFVIRGGAPPEAVAHAAANGIARLRAGERRLVVNRRSAAALLATEVVLVVLVLAALPLSDTFGLLTLALGLVLVALVGPRLSPFVQARLAAGLNPGLLAVTGVELEAPTGVRDLLTLVALGPVLVRTAPATQVAAGTDRAARAGGAPRAAHEIGVENYRVR